GRAVGGGEARDRERSLDGGAQRLGRKVGGAGMAALLAEVHRGAYALVAVVFDGLDLGLAHRDGLAVTLGHIDLAGSGANLLRMGEHVLGQIAQIVLGIAEIGHGIGLRRMERYNDTREESLFSPPPLR